MPPECRLGETQCYIRSYRTLCRSRHPCCVSQCSTNNACSGYDLPPISDANIAALLQARIETNSEEPLCLQQSAARAVPGLFGFGSVQAGPRVPVP